MTLATVLSILLASIQIIPMGNAKKYGRDGNDSLKQGQYEGAASAYQEGLSSYGSAQEEDETYYGLQNNLGLALHQNGDFEGAQNAFTEALTYAPYDQARSTPAYNAGNNAFRDQQLEQALEHYREALLADPKNEDARYNFEFVSRQLRSSRISSNLKVTIRNSKKSRISSKTRTIRRTKMIRSRMRIRQNRRKMIRSRMNSLNKSSRMNNKSRIPSKSNSARHP